jgi:hypothetical protein
MFSQIGIQCFGMGVEVHVDVGVGVGLSMGVGVGLGMGVGVGVGVGVGMGMLLVLLLLLHCCCCCCTCAAAEKSYNTTYLGIGGHSAAVEYVACAHGARKGNGVGFSARADAAADTVTSPITCVVLLVPEHLSLGLEIALKLTPVITTQRKYIPIFLHAAAALLIILLLLICLFCAFVFVVFAILTVIVLFFRCKPHR